MASLCISLCEPQVSALRSCLDSLRDATGPAASGGPALDAAGCMKPLVKWKECCEDAKVRARESAPPPRALPGPRAAPAGAAQHAEGQRRWHHWPPIARATVCRSDEETL